MIIRSTIRTNKGGRKLFFKFPFTVYQENQMKTDVYRRRLATDMEGMIELENQHAVTPNEIIDPYKDHVNLKCIKCVFTPRNGNM